MKSEKELFEKWFKKSFKDLYEAVLCGDLVAKNYKKAMYKAWKASAERKGYRLVPLKPSFTTMQTMNIAFMDNNSETPKYRMQQAYKAMIGVAK